MEIETKRFGTVEVDEVSILEAPHGIPGFRDMHRVVLMGAGTVPGHTPAGDEHSMYWLQDVEHADLAFLCIVPWVPFPDYDLEFDEHELGIIDEADVRILNFVTVRREDGAAHLTANLRAPLIIDTASQKMHQVILSDSRWPVNAPFAVKTSAEVR